jgi:hypothetical protein
VLRPFFILLHREGFLGQMRHHLHSLGNEKEDSNAMSKKLIWLLGHCPAYGGRRKRARGAYEQGASERKPY